MVDVDRVDRVDRVVGVVGVVDVVDVSGLRSGTGVNGVIEVSLESCVVGMVVVTGVVSEP